MKIKAIIFLLRILFKDHPKLENRFKQQINLINIYKMKNTIYKIRIKTFLNLLSQKIANLIY